MADIAEALPFFSLFLISAFFCIGLLINMFCPFLFSHHTAISQDTTVALTSTFSKKWNLQITGKEQYSKDSIGWFGDGTRYSVRTGSFSVSQSGKNQYGDDLHRLQGHGFDSGASDYLNDVYRILDVPEESRCSLSHCDWFLLSTNDDRMLVVSSKDDNTIYLAEMRT